MKTCLIYFLSLLSYIGYSQTRFNVYRSATGQIKQSGYFTNQQLDSIWVQYNSQGDTIARATYHLGLKHGLWMWKQDTLTYHLYYYQGKKIKYQVYNHNQLLTTKDL